MEIVIESEPSYRGPSPGPYLRSPVGSQQPPHVGSAGGFYYGSLPRGGLAAASISPDGAPTSSTMRRVDKSGLLEMAEPGASHAVLPRRVDRSGLLEVVPELPDHCCPPAPAPHCRGGGGGGLASEELLAAAATARSMVQRQHHLLGAETDLLGRAKPCRGSQTQTQAEAQTQAPEASQRRVKFAPEEPRAHPASIPDVLEAVAAPKRSPEGERAEAEGCEHTAIESLEEGRVSFKNASAAGTSAASASDAANKAAHDNIQALHVIILSEQL